MSVLPNISPTQPLCIRPTRQYHVYKTVFWSTRRACPVYKTAFLTASLYGIVGLGKVGSRDRSDGLGMHVSTFKKLI